MKTAIVLSSLFLIAGSAAALGLASRGTPAPSAMAPAQAASYGVDAVHSSVVFRIKHAAVTNFYGRFNAVSGSFSFDPAAPESGTFAFEIDNNSVDTANKDRDEHLKSPDFFNTKQFATTTFKSTKIAKNADGTFALTGDFTLHGVTKPVTASLQWLGEGEFRGQPLAAFEAVFEFKRSDFGMTKYLEGGALGDDVRVIVAVEGPKK